MNAVGEIAALACVFACPAVLNNGPYVVAMIAGALALIGAVGVVVEYRRDVP